MAQEFTSRQTGLGAFDSTVSIEFNLPHDALVSLKVYDMTGEQVDALLDDQPYMAGMHQITFSAEKYAHAVCLYRIAMKSGGRTIVEVKRIHSPLVE